MLQFTNFSQKLFLKPLKISILDLKRLCMELGELSKEAQLREIAYYERIHKVPTEASADRQKELKEELDLQINAINKFAHLSMAIEDDSGERRTIVFDQEIQKDFDSLQLPRKIKKITFDNTWNYNAVLKKFYFNHIKVELDFSDIQILDFNPTKKEQSCYIEVHGFDETNVLGTVAAIKKSFETKTLIWTNFLYRYLKYEIVVWILGIPTILFFLSTSKVDTYLFTSFPPGLQPIGYLALSFLMLIFFRLFYNYSKWLFPYLEINEQPKTFQLFQRGLAGVILIMVLKNWGAVLLELCKKLLFSD